MGDPTPEREAPAVCFPLDIAALLCEVPRLGCDGAMVGAATDPTPLASGGIALGVRDAVVVFDDVSAEAP